MTDWRAIFEDGGAALDAETLTATAEEKLKLADTALVCLATAVCGAGHDETILRYLACGIMGSGKAEAMGGDDNARLYRAAFALAVREVGVARRCFE